MWQPQEQRSRSGIAYHRVGHGPAVVLLHGIPGCAAAWAPTVDLLPESLDVIVPDLMGFGASHRPSAIRDLHAASQAEALTELIDEIGLGSFTVIGHDFGGPVAIALSGVRRTHVDALGLLAANVFPDTPIPFPLSIATLPVVGGWAQRVLFASPSLRMMLRRGTGTHTSSPDPTIYLGDPGQQRSIATIFGGSLTRLEELYTPIEGQLKDLTCPTFVGWGEQDPFFSVAHGQRTAEAAGTTLRLYARAGHFLPHERPGEVAADIMQLLDAVRH